MTEPDVDIIPDGGEVGDFGAEFIQARLDGVGILIRLGDQAQGRVGIGVESDGKAGIDPLRQLRESGFDLTEEGSVGAVATLVPGGDRRIG